jgi:uncharacterized membrane protein
MLLAVVLFVMMLATPSPASMRPGATVARGVLRVTRHPMNMAFACFGIAHVAANGFLGDVFFFGQFAVLGLVGAFHQDARLVRVRGERYREFMASTSVLPFAAILQGRCFRSTAGVADASGRDAVFVRSSRYGRLFASGYDRGLGSGVSTGDGSRARRSPRPSRNS